MLVPYSRLLFWVAAIVLPFSLGAARVPGAGLLARGALSLLALIAVTDALQACGRLKGLEVKLPDVVRMSKDREARLELRVRNPGKIARQLRLGVVMPRQIECPEEEAWITLPAEAEWSRFLWTCIGRERGNYQVKRVRVEAGSPLGFWGARRDLAAQCDVRVYPNLGTERKALAALLLHRASGLHTQRQIGKGREFEKLREYVPGDSFDEIHWKATARRGRPITKLFQIERTQEIYVVIDSSRLSARPIAGENWRMAEVTAAKAGAVTKGSAGSASSLQEPPSTALEAFITSALMLGLAAEQQGDLFGLLSFSDQVRRFVRARSGKGHFSACRDALYALDSQLVTPDYDEVCSWIRLRLRRRALLVFLTALDDPVLAEGFVKSIDLIARQHLVLVNMLQPAGVAPVFSESNVRSVEDIYDRLGGHLLWQDLRELQKVLQRRGVQFSLMRHERLSPELVSQYLGVKRKQAL